MLDIISFTNKKLIFITNVSTRYSSFHQGSEPTYVHVWSINVYNYSFLSLVCTVITLSLNIHRHFINKGKVIFYIWKILEKVNPMSFLWSLESQNTSYIQVLNVKGPACAKLYHNIIALMCTVSHESDDIIVWFFTLFTIKW